MSGDPAGRTDAIALMARYCDGDTAAFHGLYRSVAPRVLGYLVGLVRDRATAEDLLQQTFLKIHGARGAYVRGADPVPWIYAVAHRTALDELRRRQRARTHATTAPAPEDRAALGGAAEAAAAELTADRERDAAIAAALAALDRLPESQRHALLLTKVHGHSHAEAAAIVGATVGAIKLRAHRAYAALRELLRPAEPEAPPAPAPAAKPAPAADVGSRIP